MAEWLVDPTELDPRSPIQGPDEVRAVNPHRHEMELLDGILYLDEEARLAAGVKYVREDEFWARGHFPDGPVFPGVLIIEAAAQLGSFLSETIVGHGRRMVFGAASDLRFRGMVRPGDDLVLAARFINARATATRLHTQAFVGSRLVYEGQILGMLI